MRMPNWPPAARSSRSANSSASATQRTTTGEGSTAGMKLDQVKQLKAIQKENARLKKLVADLSLDKAILEEALRGNY
jgi:cell division protein FtsB